MSVSRCRYFFCPKCNHVFTKESNLRGFQLALLTPDAPPVVSGTLTCQYCGNVLQCQSIYDGTHDVPRVHWKELPPPYEL